MNRWDVVDRAGRAIYMTHERWEHIAEKHIELDSRLDDVLDTIPYGRRKQTKRDPQTYTTIVNIMIYRNHMIRY